MTIPPTAGTAPPTARTVLFEDDFSAGLPGTAGGRATSWQVRPVGPLPGGDGVARATPEGLLVRPAGTDPASGEPAFSALDVPQDLRWATFARTPGAPAPELFPAATGVLRGEAVLRARATGAAADPADPAVAAAGCWPSISAPVWCSTCW